MVPHFGLSLHVHEPVYVKGTIINLILLTENKGAGQSACMCTPVHVSSIKSLQMITIMYLYTPRTQYLYWVRVYTHL